MLISLHLPKTAGTSFRMALEEAFGESLLPDYEGMSKIQDYLAGQRPPEQLMEIPADRISSSTQCVHGHFLPAKFLPAFGQDSDTRFITWLRDPFPRLVSHYLFFKRSYSPAAGPLFRRVIEEEWSLERFCLSEEFRNIYSRYLWNFPFSKFCFVGLSEFYEEDMRYFSEAFLDKPASIHQSNRGDRKKSEQILEDSSLRAKVEAFHDEDVSLYQRALEMREKRMSGR